MSNELENTVYVYGDVCFRKQRRKRQKLLITEVFLDYAKNSTLHGLRYIAEKGLTAIEKLFWTTTFVVSVILCSILIKNVYIKWKYSPVVVTVNERLVSAGEVPFPSVTICPQIKSKARVYNISEKYNNLKKIVENNETNEELEMYADISMVCTFEEFLDTDRMFTNATIVKHIEHVAPNVNEVFLDCTWHDRSFPCNKMFKKVLTAEGVCFNMNGLAAEEMFHDTVQVDYKYSERNRLSEGWSFDEGYSLKTTNYFPKRGRETTSKPDLIVILRSIDEDSDGICNGLNSGYKIYIQHPADFPQSSTYYYAAIEGQVSSLAVSFHAFGATETLKGIPSAIRQCHFPGDRPLRYFKLYTARNCRAECLSNYTFQICKCVGYYMPHDNSSQICAEAKMQCMEFAYSKMAKLELIFELAKNDSGCQCLPACKTVEYDAEILKTNFYFERYLQKIYQFDDSVLNTTKFSKIEMYYKKPQFVSMQRSELYGKTDFLANIGGLLGLFLGFSFLSLIELFYFVTLRITCSLKRDLEEEKIKKTAVSK